jgi:hypothetical protein
MSSSFRCSPLLAILALLPAAAAGTVDTPAGFNVETHLDAGPLLLPLPDGGALLAIGSFGDEAIVRRLPNGTVIPFAAGFGSLAGAALSPVTGELVVGDSLDAVPLRVLVDLNGDLDCLDAGEDVPHAAVLPVLPNGAPPLPFDMVFRPGTDELYMAGSTHFSVFPTLGVVVRIAGGAASVHAEGFGYAGGLAWRGDALFAADVDTGTFAGRVLTLTDGNDDGDALDAGEAVEFAAGLTGANDVAISADGTVYLSGLLGGPGFSGSVGRLLADGDDDGASDGVEEGFLTGFVFSGSLVLSEGPGGFVAGAAGDGTLAIGDIGLEGDLLVHAAPLATLELSGEVANDAVFTLTLGGEPGAGAIVVLSLDQSGLTLAGLGDLALGFGAPHLILPLAALDGAGQSAISIVLHGVPGLVGTAFTAQGFTLQGGEVGISNAFDLVVAP